MAVKLEKSNQHLFRLKLERKYQQNTATDVIIILVCYFSILMEKLVSVEPKLSAKDSDSIKQEILQQLDTQIDN